MNESCGTHSLESQFFPFAEDVSDFPEGEGEKCPPAGSYVRIIFLISIPFFLIYICVFWVRVFFFSLRMDREVSMITVL